MSVRDNFLGALGRVIDLREREVDRLSEELASRQAVRQRYVANIERLGALCHSSGATATMSPALSLNSAAYKQSLVQMTLEQRTDLALHESETVHVQAAVHAAVRGQESLTHVFEKRELHLSRASNGREQKRQDDMAAQVWQRGQS